MNKNRVRLGLDNLVEEIMNTIDKSPSIRHVNYVGFGLHLSEALDLARKLRDEPYAYDKDGEIEFKYDLNELCDKLSLLKDQFLNNRENWS